MRIVYLVAVGLIVVSVFGQTPSYAQERSAMDKPSRLFGYRAAQELMAQGFDVNKDVNLSEFLVGFRLAAKNSPLGIKDSEMKLAFDELKGKIDSRRSVEISRNQTEGNKFMQSFLRQKNAVKLDDEVAYQVLRTGAGTNPDANDKVTVKFKGQFTDGKVFQSSGDDKPFIESVDKFVPGLSKALQTMKVGEKRKIVVLGPKAFGMFPPPGIEINKTVVFEVDLINVEKVN